MNKALQDLEGFEAVASGVSFPWNSPFRTVREGIEGKPVRQIEEQGLRMIRFEETVPSAEGEESVDLQNELYFSPDYGYGLRSASVRIEGIGSRSHLKHEGSYRPLVLAYFRLYRIFEQRYGRPQLTSHLHVEDPDSLVRILDHTRDALYVSAIWLGPKTEVHHELHVSFAPRHVLRFAPVSSRLTLKNETGRGGVKLEITFEGGCSEAALPAGGEKVVEIPPEGEVTLRVNVAGKTCRARLPVRGRTPLIRIRRRRLTGTPYLEAR